MNLPNTRSLELVSIPDPARPASKVRTMPGTAALLFCVCALLGAPQAQAARRDFTTGVWLTEGYGQAFMIVGDHLVRYEVTAGKEVAGDNKKNTGSCMEDASATRVQSTDDVERFVGPAVNPDTGAKDTFIFTRDDDDDEHLTLHVEGAIADIGLKPGTLPDGCVGTHVSTPFTNFDIFANTFREQYAFFKLRHMDWDAVVAEHRAAIRDGTKDPELFEHFKAMIEPLQDAHTGIAAPALGKSKTFDGWRPPAPIGKEAGLRAHAIIDQRYLVTPLTWYCNETMGFGMLPDKVGYLRIDSFEGYADDASFDKQIEVLNAALDNIFRQAREMKGLVIDVRLNGGGADEFGTILAGRLTRHPYLAYSKIYRIDPRRPSRFSRPQRIMVKASRRPGFYGPVALLIGHESVSAAETFAMAMQGRERRTVFVGENTQGVFSDVLTRILPNGWTFGVPNEIYLTEDDEAYDLVGVPPDVRVPVFARGDIARGRDPALEAGVQAVTDDGCDTDRSRKKAASATTAGVSR